MQVFIVGSPLETARAMAGDTRRYNKQIIEVRQILDALNGAKAWSNHPCVLQYRGREEWLRAYKECLEWYVRGDEGKALWASTLADYWRHDDELKNSDWDSSSSHAHIEGKPKFKTLYRRLQKWDLPKGTKVTFSFWASHKHRKHRFYDAFVVTIGEKRKR